MGLYTQKFLIKKLLSKTLWCTNCLVLRFVLSVVLGMVLVVLGVVLEQVEAVAKPLLVPVLKKPPPGPPKPPPGPPKTPPGPIYDFNRKISRNHKIVFFLVVGLFLVLVVLVVVLVAGRVGGAVVASHYCDYREESLQNHDKDHQRKKTLFRSSAGGLFHYRLE